MLPGDTGDSTLRQVEVKDDIQPHNVQSPILHSIGGNEGTDVYTLFDVCGEELCVEFGSELEKEGHLSSCK